jgi:hypothetical protein
MALEQSPEPPPTLYHYTGAAGFHGILKDSQMFLTHSAYLNDQGEMGYPVRRALKVVRHLKTLAGGRDKLFWEYLEVVCQAHSHVGRWYVGSFSTNGNQLSQWRAYTPAGGYSIGFQSKALADVFSGRFGPVIYDEAAQERALSSTLGMLLNAWQGAAATLASASDVDKYNGVFFPAVAELLTQSFIFWKSQAFSEEAEWRVAISAWAPRVQFHVRNDIVTPYVAQDLPRERGLLPLDEIYVSPLGDPSLAHKSAVMLTESLGYTSRPVIKSAEIALRSPRRN